MSNTQVITDTWSFWTPLEKAEEDSSDGTRRIKGIASTDDEDLQGEIVKQGGIDTSYFLKYGYFNNDHKPGAKNKVGQPTLCRHTKDGLYVEGTLFKGSHAQVANELWDFILTLKDSDSDRRVGMSVQGKTRRRQGNIIMSSWIQDIAITPAPINTHTWVDILKSFSGCTWCANQGTDVCLSCGKCSKSLTGDEDSDAEKALSVGHGNPTVGGGTSGAALRTESLDSDDKDLSFGAKDKRLTKSQITEIVQRTTGYSYPTAALCAEALFTFRI